MVTTRTRRFPAWLAAAFAAGLAAVPAAPAAAQDVERFTLSGDAVAVYDLVGRMDVVSGTGPDIVVEVRRGGRDAGELRIGTGEIDGRETLRVIFPDDDIVYPELGRRSRTTIRVNDDGTFGDSGWFGRGRRVEVRGSGGGLEAWADVRVLVPTGRRVAVNLGVGEATVRGVEGELRVDAASGRVSAERTRGRLSIDTGSGSVSVTDARGDLDIDTGSGGVDVMGASGGRIRVDTGSGSVAAAGLTADEIEIDTGSGGIEARDVRADRVALDTGSGSVEVGLLADLRELLIDTGSGGVTVAVPDELGADIEIDTGSGGIELDVPVEMHEAERNYFRGRIGDGGGRIEIDTGSGGVRFVRG